MTVKEAFQYTKEKLKSVTSEYKLESLLLLSYILEVEKEKIYLRENDLIDEEKEKKLKLIIEKRKIGYPLAYILKSKEFMGLNFFIDEGVLIPRQETETLVETALKKAKKDSYFLDIGCGSGVIAISLLYYEKSFKGKAIDISNKAIEVTTFNAQKFGVLDRLNIQKINFKDLEDFESFEFVVSNPPYVKKENLKNLPFEPREALDGGDSGFEIYPDLIKKSFSLLKNGGFVLFEIDPEIKDLVYTEMKKYFKNIEIIKDLANLDRFVYGGKVWRINMIWF